MNLAWDGIVDTAENEHDQSRWRGYKLACKRLSNVGVGSEVFSGGVFPGGRRAADVQRRLRSGIEAMQGRPASDGDSVRAPPKRVDVRIAPRCTLQTAAAQHGTNPISAKTMNSCSLLVACFSVSVSPPNRLLNIDTMTTLHARSEQLRQRP